MAETKQTTYTVNVFDGDGHLRQYEKATAPRWLFSIDGGYARILSFFRQNGKIVTLTAPTVIVEEE